MRVLKTQIRSRSTGGVLYLRAEDVGDWLEKSKQLSEDPVVKSFVDSQVKVIKKLHQ